MNKAEQNKNRNEEICKRYVEGGTLKSIAFDYGLSSERVRQILQRGGISKHFRAKQKNVGLKDGVFVTDERGEFLGVNLSEEDKTALREEAARRGISMSKLSSNIIQEMLESLRTSEESRQ